MAEYMGMPGVSAPEFNPDKTAGNAPWGGATDASGNYLPVNGVEQPTGTQGGKGTVPHVDIYAEYGRQVQANNGTMSRRADLGEPLDRHLFEPFPGTRQGWQLGAVQSDGTHANPSFVGDGRGREYMGPWVNPWNTDLYKEAGYRSSQGEKPFAYNQMIMTTEQSFDPFIQKSVLEYPYQWINRIPRRAFRLHNGLVHETNIFRGGLEVYSGLSDWEPLQADPREKDPCGPMKYRTYDYAWEKMMWSGMKTAWGSDPFCIDLFKFVPDAMEQLGWIIEAGARFGIAIQNIWNRDNFIKFSVQAGRSYVMSKEYRGTSSERYVYDPMCKFEKGWEAALAEGASAEYGKADFELVHGKPFIVVSAEVDMEPVNFQALQILRRELSRVARDASVATVAGEPAFGIGINSEDVDNFIRGNQEERKYFIEGDPMTLSKGYDFVGSSTFRKWVIMEDGDQLRFNVIRYIGEYTAEEAAKYGLVGYKELAGKKVFVCGVVDPVRAGRPGINGSPIPEPNPEYDLAEIAIAPVFINTVYTNEFVPSENTLGHGTYFGPVGGLNGTWKWYNIQTEQNPDQRVGNFRGLFEIVPKPEKHAIYATSLVYRRCAQPLKSLCPVENKTLNESAVTRTTTTAVRGTVASDYTAELRLAEDTVFRSGDLVKVTPVAKAAKYSYGSGDLASAPEYDASATGKEWSAELGGKTYVCAHVSGESTTASVFFATTREMTEDGGTAKIHVVYVPEVVATAYEAMVYNAPTQQVKLVQFTGATDGTDRPYVGTDLAGATFAKA